MQTAEKLAIDGGTPVRGKEHPLPDVFPRAIGPNVRRYLEEVLASGLMSDMIGRFERAFAEVCRTKFACTLDNCTASVHAATAAVGVEPGDHVVVSPITDYGSVAGVLWQNALPLFPDVDVRTGNVTAGDIEKVLTPRTRAIIVVHFYGMPCDMDPIMELARKRGIPVIEDACQAVMAEYRGRRTGSLADCAAFSFDGEKNMPADHGGAVTTNNEEIDAAVRKFGLARGATPKPGYGRTHDTIGLNYRFGVVLSALALGNLELLPEHTAQRQRMAELLSEKIARIPGVHPPHVIPQTKPTWWLYYLRFDLERFTADLDTLCAALNAEGLPGGHGRYYLLPESHTFLTDRGHLYGKGRFPFDYFPADAIPDYHPDMCPKARAHVNSVFRTFWTEKLTERDIADMATIVHKVAEHYRK